MEASFPKVWLFSVIVLFSTKFTCNVAGQDEAETLADFDLKEWQKYYNDGKKVLLLLYKPEGECPRCKKAVDAFQLVLGQPEVPSDVTLGKSSNKDVIEQLGITSFPALVFLREKSTVVYDGDLEVEAILAWIPLAYEVALQTLDDTSFEHLTQASTGATTGDWLVTFYTEDCKAMLPVLETVGVRARQQVNVAKVKMLDSPELVDRFKVKQCPTTIYFRQGRMYRYDLKQEVSHLNSFLGGFYKNAKAEIVPVPKSKFDHLTEEIADFLKQQLEGENRTLVLGGVSAMALIFLLVILVCCRSVLQNPPKEKGE